MRLVENIRGSQWVIVVTAISQFSVSTQLKLLLLGKVAGTNNDPELAQRMTELRSHGIVRERERFVQEEAGPWIMKQSLGFNYRMSDLQAILGLSQLKRLEQIVFERNLQLQHYRKLIAHLPVELSCPNMS